MDAPLTDAPGNVPWMIVDRQEAIVSHSPALRRLLNLPQSHPVVGRTFGEVSGCINAFVEESRCGLTSRCRSCPLNRAVGRARNEGRPYGPDVLQRTCIVDGQFIERAHRIFTHPVKGDGPGQVLVTFEQQGSEKALWKRCEARAPEELEMPIELVACAGA